MWLAYRDLEAGDLRDFQIVRSDADPPAFTPRTKLSADGWRIQGCPETGARMAQAPDGVVWAAWFTAGGEPGVYVTSSPDEGASFASRKLLSPPGHPGRHPEIGVLPDGSVAVLYDVVEALRLTCGRRTPSILGDSRPLKRWDRRFYHARVESDRLIFPSDCADGVKP